MGRVGHRGPCAGGRISGWIEARRGRGAGRRRPAVSRGRALRRRDADRQPRRPDAARAARARDRSTRSPARTRATARRCCATSAIAKPLLAVHEHNEREAAGAVLARLARGERVAYVSDAGTPAVSDPGAALVAAVRAARATASCRSRARAARWPRSSAAGDARLERLRVRRLPRRARRRASARARRARARAGDAGRVRGAAPHRSARRRARRRVPRSRRRRCAASSPSSSRRSRRCRRAPCRRGSAADPNRAARRVRRRPARARRRASARRAAMRARRVLVPLLAALPLKQAVALAAEISAAPRNVLYARALELKGHGPARDDRRASADARSAPLRDLRVVLLRRGCSRSPASACARSGGARAA